MPSGNRVEELESRVKELEATVDGLTDELVECKVRLRELEGAVDQDVGLPPVQEEAPATPSEGTPEGEAAEAESEEATEEETDTSSDIIVA